MHRVLCRLCHDAYTVHYHALQSDSKRSIDVSPYGNGVKQLFVTVTIFLDLLKWGSQV
jgi:hypothetical protein